MHDEYMVMHLGVNWSTKPLLDETMQESDVMLLVKMVFHSCMQYVCWNGTEPCKLPC